MPLTIKVIPGYQFYEGEKLDTNKLNQLGRPTLDLLGSISSAIIATGSITADKLAPGLISSLPHKDNLDGSDLLMIEDRSSVSLKNITISQVLVAGIKDLPVATAVKYTDFAFVIQSGVNKQATILDTLREAIFGQSLINRAGDIDTLNDMVMFWDANAVAGSNPNRKARIGDFVASFTNTLIAKSLPFTGTLDRDKDEILMNSAALTAPDQQVRVPLGKFLEQAGGTKAWANVHASEVVESIPVSTWNDTADIISTAADHLLRTGEVVWFPTLVNNSGVDPWTPYFLQLLQGTTEFRLFKTKAGALNNEIAQLVNLGPSTTQRNFLRWKAEPIRAGFNIASIITTATSSDQGYFRVTFLNPMASENYVVQLTGSYYHGDGDRQAMDCAINVAGSGSDPDQTSNPTAGQFDVVCRRKGDDKRAPDYLMISVFA